VKKERKKGTRGKVRKKVKKTLDQYCQTKSFINQQNPILNENQENFILKLEHCFHSKSVIN
jgi:hypothetical protein